MARALPPQIEPKDPQDIIDSREYVLGWVLEMLEEDEPDVSGARVAIREELGLEEGESLADKEIRERGEE